MRPVVHDALAYCRYEHDRCARTLSVSQTLSAELSRRLTLLTLQLARNVRIRRIFAKELEVLAQQRRVLNHGASAKYVI